MPVDLHKMFTILENQDPYDLRSAYLLAMIVTAGACLLSGILLRGTYHFYYLLCAIYSPSTHVAELNRVDSMRARVAMRQILLHTNSTSPYDSAYEDDKKRA